MLCCAVLCLGLLLPACVAAEQAICKWMEPLKRSAGAIVITGDLNAPPDEELHEVAARNGFASSHKVGGGLVCGGGQVGWDGGCHTQAAFSSEVAHGSEPAFKLA